MMTARHVQLLRALFAAVAAVMITFSPDHSAEVGLAVFSGFAAASALILALSAWLVRPAGQRGRIVLLTAVYLVAGVVAGTPQLRGTTALFAVLIAWGLLAGLVELVIGIVDRRTDRVIARDTIFVGALTMLLGVASIVVRPEYRLDYFIEDAGRTFTLTGTIIAVGLFGAYAAIVAAFLGIAGLSPRPVAPAEPAPASALPTPKDPT
ncbi:acyl-CoA synthetase [Microbacterium sediminis]|uniref:Acyl-CoA synthetase n=1 Tax=Microbacterium sediminis TaxID=904291 RepID=A0A1B9NAI1_9MICO|nr:acyl-CoA synthetase [Microbacterium sediminis]OCG73621.1 acyl-CoA synthetase [Microbacterium sediminis]QBR75305.1 acyl-CoA synthetase [Microbacterium sediminis]